MLRFAENKTVCFGGGRVPATDAYIRTPAEKKERRMASDEELWADFYEARAEQEGAVATVETAHFDLVSSCCGESWTTDRAQGAYVCTACGLVSPMPIVEHVFSSVMQGKLYSSYQRFYHWNERITQFLCMETPVAKEHALVIREAFAGVHPRKVTKNAIRAVLRKLGWSTRYGEKWISIRCDVTGEAPPNPDSALVEFLRRVFPFFESAFVAVCPSTRTSMISYNYLFVRALQFRHAYQYMKYFPLVKQKAKIRAIGDIWDRMCGVHEWEVLPLPKPRFFQFVSEGHAPRRV